MELYLHITKTKNKLEKEYKVCKLCGIGIKLDNGKSKLIHETPKKEIYKTTKDITNEDIKKFFK